MATGARGPRRARSRASSSAPRRGDGGHTWSPLADEPALPDPRCQRTILRLSDAEAGGRGRLLFANAASPAQRANGTVRLSYDEGRTWPVGRVVYPGPLAYSCLAALADGTIGPLHERDGYTTITFARLDLAWLTNGEDRL